MHHCERQDHPIGDVLDRRLVAQAEKALDGSSRHVRIDADVTNTDLSVGAMLSGELVLRHGRDGLPDDSIKIALKGSAGQSFGAFLARGVTLDLEGEANDYVGKGLSGGRVNIRPPAACRMIVPERSMLIGNTVLYGATSGECCFHGQAGERFAVRNAGAVAVVEGVGDHCCEYMTGGCVVVIGGTGKNFAAGMTGGVAYVLDESGDFTKRCNTATVQTGAVSSPDHVERLRDVLFMHVDRTGSGKARSLLSEWDRYVTQFTQVSPLPLAGLPPSDESGPTRWRLASDAGENSRMTTRTVRV